MVEWVFILAPLFVLPVFILFRFIGCGPERVSDDEPIVEQVPAPPKYRDYILGESIFGKVRHDGVKPDGAAVKGYWRLVDNDMSKGAKDEKGKFPGVYQSTGSAGAAPGIIDSNLRKALLISDPAESHLFNGGFVSISDTGGLYPQEFTIEAWVHPGDAVLNGPKDVEHILFQAGGHFIRFPESTEGDHGFQILAIGHQWQVKFAPFIQAVLSQPPDIPIGTSHLAVTFKRESPTSANTKVTPFVNGIEKPSQIVLKFYSTPTGAPFFIGAGVQIGKWRDFDKEKAHHPFRSYIQDVVLHNKVLGQNEIDNHYGIGRDS
jgi:hypothetical protein